MSQAKQGDTVKVHYTGKFVDGTVFDSTSINKEPMEFTIGKGQVIPAFEQAIVGMKPGDTKTIQLPAAKAYGEMRKELITVVDKSKFPAHMVPEVGMQLQLQPPEPPNSPPLLLMIIDITDTTITLDANHPLAGKDLTFDIQFVEVV